MLRRTGLFPFGRASAGWTAPVLKCHPQSSKTLFSCSKGFTTANRQIIRLNSSFPRRRTNQFPPSQPPPPADNFVPQNPLPTLPPPPRTVIAIIAGYLITINAIAAGMFFYDKYQATKRGWRVPEKQLQLTALLGGWIGGVWAMNQARHKTVKKSFRDPYFFCVAANVGILSGGLMGWRYSPTFRNAVFKLFRQGFQSSPHQQPVARPMRTRPTIRK
ncbi:hypothetical protein DFS34DRAFT_92384 [Phlyctochytrium arcticum]|nr:hypothetical protein DFS34DRAFT_92384 [Phlyctochytrium arcticum]